MSQHPSTDLIVVGGGIAGCAIAWAALRRGLRVRLLDAGGPTESASWQSGGMLAPKAEALTGDMLDLGQRALRAFPAYLEDLAQASGAPIHHGRGVYLPILDGDPSEWLLNYAAARQRDGDLVEVLEPGAWPGPRPGARLTGALILADEGFVDPRGLMIALNVALNRGGAAVEFGVTVTKVTAGDSGVTVMTAAGERSAAHIAVATGHQNMPFRGIAWDEHGPVFGDRGLMLRVQGIAPPPAVLYHHGTDGTTYVVPDPHGVRVGSTSDPGDQRRTAAPAEVAALLHRALRIWPALRDGRMTEAGVGFRPCGPRADHMPFAGPIDRDGHVYGLLGLHRNGILLAPLLADQLLAQLAD